MTMDLNQPNNQPSQTYSQESPNQLQTDANGVSITPGSATIKATGEEWFLMDGVPGVGKKPEFYNDKKYKSVLEEARAHSELEKYVSATRKNDAVQEVPATYEATLSEELVNKGVTVNKEDPLYQGFEKYAKESKLSQDQFNKIINYYIDHQTKNMDQLRQDIDMESEKALKEVGVRSTPEIARNELKAWLNNNGASAYQEDIDYILTDPKALKVLSLIRENTNHGVPVPQMNNAPAHNMDYFLQKKAEKRYQNELGYRNRIDKEFEMAVKNGSL